MLKIRKMKNKNWFIVSFILSALAVALGAFGAKHGELGRGKDRAPLFGRLGHLECFSSRGARFFGAAAER